MSKPGQFRADLPELARHLLTDGPHKTQPTARRVRVILNSTCVVDTTKAVHVWEHVAYPQYYVPIAELRNCRWKDKQDIQSAADASQAAAAVVEVAVPGRDGENDFTTDRALRFSDNGEISGALKGLIRLEFGSMDQWLEEETPIYVHPKDPYKRIDILPSSRPVEVKVAGKTVAKTNFASALRKSKLITKCPYKGDAEYYNVVVDGKEYNDLVWYYRLPTQESAGIAGLLCFYNEKVDIILDGELLERPKTFFS
ncbi:uncharacterized protein BDZ83DRAFT_634478 [Colletotrichum acutatum]|uniref:DUF427 domain-containing protein n=1 Tax=Glomerella acutata TaxID=27357 RepID=A0AAD8XEF4_GLOAC|nr:uncharacterized protein BDZ83DRAFT_634478 [Colletotrichum acutatum]KAK1716710.1 hypothetical protein BDZ83DRAFT_634478 [Colletotrichum acutatum]